MAETVLLIFITLINISLWIVFFVRFKKRFSPEILLSDIKNEVDKLLIEINRTVDRDITLIENRIRDLKALIETADAHLKIADKEKKEREREERVLKKLSEKKIPQQHGVAYTPAAAVEKYAHMQSYNEENGVQLSIDFDSFRTEPEITAAPLQEIPIKDQVISLYAEGFSAELISKKVKLSITEVELIIDLFCQ